MPKDLRKRLGVAVVLLGTMGHLGACTQCHITVRDGNAGNAIHAKTVWGNEYITAEADPGQFSSPGLHSVVIKDNWFYDIVGVATFGLFKPTDIEYRNLKPGADDGGDMRPPAPGGGR